MSTIVVVTAVVLILPCVMLVKPPSAVYNRGRLSVVPDLRAPLIFIDAGMKIPYPVNQHDNRRLEDTRTLYLIHNGSESYRRQRHIFIRTIVKVLMIVLVTVVGTFLYIRSGQTQRSFSVYHMIDNDDDTQNHETFLLVTNSTVITVTTAASFDVTHTTQRQNESQMAEEDVSAAIVKERTLSNHSIFEGLQANSRSLNSDIIRENNLIFRPVISNSRTPPVHGNVMKGNHSLINHKSRNNIVDNDKVYNNISTIVNDRLYHMTKNESNQMIHHGYSTTESITRLVGEDVSNSYYNVNDLADNVDDYGNNEVKIPLKDNKIWTTNGPSEQLHIDQLSSLGSGSGSYGQNSYYNSKSRYQTGHTINYRPLITKPKKMYQPSKGLEKKTYEKTIPQYLISSKMDWKNIEVFPLIKRGILKLKMIGFLQLVFLIGLKFKLLMMAIFFKFILFLKLLKFFKILILPVYIFSLFPILTLLFNRMVNMQTSSGLSSSSSSGSSSFINLPGGMSSGGFSSGSSSGGTLFPVSPGSSSGIPGLTEVTLLPGLSRSSRNKLFYDLSAVNIIQKLN